MPGSPPTTTRLGLPRYAQTDAAQFSPQVNAIVDALDLIAARTSQGLRAARPAAGIAGRFYFSTDIDELAYDDGTSWNAFFYLGSAAATVKTDATLQLNAAAGVEALRVVGGGTGLAIVPVATTPNAPDLRFGDGTGWMLGFAPLTGANAGKRFLRIRGSDGRLEWADPTTGTTDITIGRSLAGTIAVGGGLTVAGNLSMSVTGAFIQRNAAAPTTQVVAFRSAALTVDQLAIDATGKLSWGDGTNPVDTNLYRPTATPSTLKTDDAFEAKSVKTTGGDVLTDQPVLDVGITGQIRAGRQLTVADFTNMGLGQPVGLWNLSSVATLGSESARPLVQKAPGDTLPGVNVPFGTGINGAASTSAVFAGGSTQALYILDIANDPFRIRSGSWGCWFRTARRGTAQLLIDKYGGGTSQRSYRLELTTANVLNVLYSTDGATARQGPTGVSDVCDDRWHHVVATWDGETGRLYVDGTLEAVGGSASGPLFASTSVFNLGAGAGSNTTAAAAPHYGRIDEAFVTGDVLTEDQIRCLYAAKLPHTLGMTPASVSLNVRRSRKGGNLANTDFPAQPLRLYNFQFSISSTVGWGDAGTNNSGQLTPAAGSSSISGAAGELGQGLSLTGVGVGAIATDAGLPAGTTTRSYGCWFKTTVLASMGIMGWGTNFTNDASLRINTSGQLVFASGADTLTLPQVISDGLWHHVVAVEDNAAGDYRRKLYLDGRIQAASTVLTSITLISPTVTTGFRIGANANGSQPFFGSIDGVFVAGTAYTATQVATLYAAGAQALAPSPKNAGDHVEALGATDVLFIGDTLDSNYTVDLGVVA